MLGFELTFIGRVVFPSSQLIPGRGDLTPSLTISLQFGNLNTSLMLFKLEESKFDKDLSQGVFRVVALDYVQT